MYGSHKHGTVHKSQIQRGKKASLPMWRTRDGIKHPVTVRRIPVGGGVKA